MGRKRKKVVKAFKKYKKVGYYWCGLRCGTFCPDCGEPAYLRNGIHPRYVCLNCGWEEAQAKIRVISRGGGKYDLVNENIP